MGAVDQADQLRVHYNTQRVHHKFWKALLRWLLDMTIVNSYKLSSYKTQFKFRQDLVQALSQYSERLTTCHYDRSSHIADLVCQRGILNIQDTRRATRAIAKHVSQLAER